MNLIQAFQNFTGISDPTVSACAVSVIFIVCTCTLLACMIKFFFHR